MRCAFRALKGRASAVSGLLEDRPRVAPLGRYANMQHPLPHEKLPPPIVADLDGDGTNEVVLVTKEPSVRTPSPWMPSTHLQSLPLPDTPSLLSLPCHPGHPILAGMPSLVIPFL